MNFWRKWSTDQKVSYSHSKNRDIAEVKTSTEIQLSIEGHKYQDEKEKLDTDINKQSMIENDNENTDNQIVCEIEIYAHKEQDISLEERLLWARIYKSWPNRIQKHLQGLMRLST